MAILSLTKNDHWLLLLSEAEKETLENILEFHCGDEFLDPEFKGETPYDPRAFETLLSKVRGPDHLFNRIGMTAFPQSQSADEAAGPREPPPGPAADISGASS